MTLILIRHGETKEGKKGILLGQLPGNLTGAGKQEMIAAAKKIREEVNPEVIFSSDLKRAKDSAKILSNELGLNVVYNKLLRERSGGDAEGKTEEKINWKEYERVSLPYRKHKGGESFIDVKNRAEEFLEFLRSQKYKTVIIVSHSAFLAMLISKIKRWSIKKSLKEQPKKLK